MHVVKPKRIGRICADRASPVAVEMGLPLIELFTCRKLLVMPARRQYSHLASFSSRYLCPVNPASHCEHRLYEKFSTACASSRASANFLSSSTCVSRLSSASCSARRLLN